MKAWRWREKAVWHMLDGQLFVQLPLFFSFMCVFGEWGGLHSCISINIISTNVFVYRETLLFFFRYNQQFRLQKNELFPKIKEHVSVNTRLQLYTDIQLQTKVPEVLPKIPMKEVGTAPYSRTI